MKKEWSVFGILARTTLIAAIFASLILVPVESNAAPFPATACAAARFGGDVGCTANDVSLAKISLAPGSIASCVSGAPVTLDLDLTVNFSSPNRYDVGIFIANDGKLPTLLPANGGASSCSVDVLPITTPPFGDAFPDLDGAPQSTADTCGDGGNLLTGVKRMTGVTLPCFASTQSGGQLFVPFALSWDSQKSPSGSLCTSSLDAAPSGPSKCNTPTSSVAVDVVVLPVITKTNGATTINPGANTTYTVVVRNDSGGTLLDSVFTDPAVTNLTVNSITCAGAGGASCPTATVVAMQGAGIPIPSANLPNNSSLTFTIKATLASVAPEGGHLINTASVTVGGHTNSATDDDLIVIAPAAVKSFAPSTITAGAASVLSITLTNPTTSAVTGVSFTDTYPSGLVNTASANGATSCGGTVTAANNGNSVALSGGMIPASGNCTVTVNVTSAIAGSYTNSTGAVTNNGSTIPAASAMLTVNTPVFGAFNACDVATRPNVTCTNTTTVTNSHIATKIAGLPFNLDIVALKTDGSRNTNYGNDVSVELLDSSNNSGALDANNCRSTWTTVIATLNPNPVFASANSGLITTGVTGGTFSVPEAYRDVRVRVKNVGGSANVGCSTDNFAIRPNNLAVSRTDADWQTTGTMRALNNTDTTNAGSSTGTSYPIHKAGQAFTVVATAQNASSVTTAKYAGTPTSVLSPCSGASPAFSACTTSLGALALGTAGVGSGVVTWNSATYSEVGAFNLTLQDRDFASVDAADTAATCAGRYVCSAAIPVGRFVPDHFSLSGGTVVNRTDIGSGAGCSPASIFSYMGEPLRATLTLTAYNGLATPTITANYAGGFAKLDGTAIASFGFRAVDLADAAPPIIATALTPRLALGVSNGTWVAGIGTFTAGFAVNRAATPDGPFESFRLGAIPVDTDGVTLLAADLNLDTDIPTNGNDRSLVGSSKIRFGRLQMQNAHGSELLKLPVPTGVQYWNGAGWISNANDSCTQVPVPASVAFATPLDPGLTFYAPPPTAKNTLASGDTTATINGASSGNGTFTSGNGGLVLSAPFPHTGYVDIVLAAPLWLQFNWIGVMGNPRARATFGIYKNANKFIYMREMY